MAAHGGAVLASRRFASPPLAVQYSTGAEQETTPFDGTEQQKEEILLTGFESGRSCPNRRREWLRPEPQEEAGPSNFEQRHLVTVTGSAHTGPYRGGYLDIGRRVHPSAAVGNDWCRSSCARSKMQTQTIIEAEARHASSL
ncbi:unnamed protein product [Parajaminaea phylloscopi]